MSDDASPPIVCDMTGAEDTPLERLAEYQRLFAQHLLGRERTEVGIRFRLRAEDGVEAWVRDLAAREKSCCGFMDFDVTRHDDEVHWDGRVVDDDLARQVLDEFHLLPDTLGDGTSVDAVYERFPAPIVLRDGGRCCPSE